MPEEHNRRPGICQRTTPLDDQLEHTVEVGLACDRTRDLRRRLERRHRAFELPLPTLHLRVGARIVDRDRRPVGEHHKRFLVVLVERAVTLLRQIQIPVRLTPHEDRRPEEASHRRVTRRKPERARMRANVVEAKRNRFTDQHAEHAMPTWEIPDRQLGRLVNPYRHEPFELTPTGIEHPERRVLRPRQLPRSLQHTHENCLEIQLDHEASPHLDQTSQPLLHRRTDRRHSATATSRSSAPPEARGEQRGRRPLRNERAAAPLVNASPTAPAPQQMTSPLS